MRYDQAAAKMVDWANANISKFPKEFKPETYMTILDSKIFIEKAVSEITNCMDKKQYGSGFTAAYYRLYKLKKWLDEREG